MPHRNMSRDTLTTNLIPDEFVSCVKNMSIHGKIPAKRAVLNPTKLPRVKYYNKHGFILVNKVARCLEMEYKVHFKTSKRHIGYIRRNSLIASDLAKCIWQYFPTACTVAVCSTMAYCFITFPNLHYYVSALDQSWMLPYITISVYSPKMQNEYRHAYSLHTKYANTVSHKKTENQ